MDRSVVIAALVALGAIAVLSFAVPSVLGAGVVVIFASTIFLVVFRNYSDDVEFITRIFLVGLVLRLAFGIIIYGFDLRDFFGGDAITYDGRGALLNQYWSGELAANDPELDRATNPSGPGWGMTYFVGAVYWIFGRNFLAAQSLAAVFGAATAPMAYYCAQKIFANRNVARYTAIAIAVFPSFVIWSGQLMKDGLIIFLLVVAVTMVMALQERFSYPAIVLLVLSLGGIISLRFYIFYMVAVAVAGSFVVGLSNSTMSLLRRAAALVLLGVSLTYLGVVDSASTTLERYGDLERVQVSRMDQAQRAGSGYEEDVDVSTTRGAISALPVGFIYLMLAPFPGQVTNLRQAITLPESLLWWALLPLCVSGVIYSVRHRLKSSLPILVFSGLLTLVYSIFQSNVGTAYRQRTQIQVFLFMFIAAGFVLYKERREDRKLIRQARQRGPVQFEGEPRRAG